MCLEVCIRSLYSNLLLLFDYVPNHVVKARIRDNKVLTDFMGRVERNFTNFTRKISNGRIQIVVVRLHITFVSNKAAAHLNDKKFQSNVTRDTLIHSIIPNKEFIPKHKKKLQSLRNTTTKKQVHKTLTFNQDQLT